MRENLLDVDDLAQIVNERDQPILVPAHIEHRQIAHEVGGAEVCFQRAGVLLRRSLDSVCPVLERLGRLREAHPEFPNPPLANDSHTPSSHIWNQQVKRGRLILFAFGPVPERQTTWFHTAMACSAGTACAPQAATWENSQRAKGSPYH